MKKSKFMFTKAAAFLLAMLIIPLFSTCNGKEDPEPEPEPSSEKVLTLTKVTAGANNTSLPFQKVDDVTFDIQASIDFLEANKDALKTAKVEFTLSEKATASINSGQTVNLNDGDVTIKVTAENKSTVDYKLHVIKGKSDKAEIVSFKLVAGEEKVEAKTIDKSTRKITFDAFPYEKLNFLKTAVPEFEVSLGASAVPASGTTNLDFSKEVEITVTAEDGTASFVWSVETEIEPTEGDIIGFSLSVVITDDDNREVPMIDIITDNENKEITFLIPGWMNDPPWGLSLVPYLANAIPRFTLTPKATADIVSGVARSFASDVVIKVTAEDGGVHEWTVKRRFRSEISMSHFWLDFRESDDEDSDTYHVIANINKATNEITYTLPLMPQWFTKDKMYVVPSMFDAGTNVTVEPSHNAARDFSSGDLLYKVYAEDGVTFEEWTVKKPASYRKMTEKWSKPCTDYYANTSTSIPSTAEGPNSIALIGNYLNLGRTNILINKSDGTKASELLNVDGWRARNGQAANVAEPLSITQDYPFFVANDDAGNLLGINLGSWNTEACVVTRWTSPTAAPVEILNMPTKVEGVAQANLGRKLLAVGNVVTGDGLLIANNSLVVPVGTPVVNHVYGEHFMMKVKNGVVDLANLVKVDTGIEDQTNYSYQMLCPLGLEPVEPYYVSTRVVGSEYPKLRFGNIGSLTEIKGPFDLGSAENTRNGWGDRSFHYLKLFKMDGQDMIATFTGNANDFYCFAVHSRVTNTNLVSVVGSKVVIPWDSAATETPNGNWSGSFTMEQVGDDIFFYVFPTNKGVYCYRLEKFTL